MNHLFFEFLVANKYNIVLSCLIIVLSLSEFENIYYTIEISERTLSDHMVQCHSRGFVFVSFR